MNKSLDLSSALMDYVLDHSEPLGPVARRLIDTTEALGGIAVMQVSPEQAVFLRLMVQLIGARRILEIGTFTGLSALVMAEALPKDGRVICLDQSEEWTSIGRRFWDEAGVSDRIELRLGDAKDSLRAMPESERFDLVFIDADKTGYPVYYEQALSRLNRGGVIMVDNTLWSGRVIDLADQDADTIAIRAFNSMLATDGRIDVMILPIADGLTLARPRVVR
jgi:caffeoyl-CoA O-methyltransferase